MMARVAFNSIYIIYRAVEEEPDECGDAREPVRQDCGDAQD